MQALINKETLHTICCTKEVSAPYIAARSKCHLDKIERWLNPQDLSLPTFSQAKAIAKCLHIPFAGLYMDPADLPLEQIRKYNIRNFRTMLDGFSADDSALNIAIGDLLQAKNFLINSNAELGESVEHFSVIFSPINDTPIAWASEIRKVFSIDLKKQLDATSTRKFYLYVRNLIESSGVFVHCFTDVPIDIARGIAIYEVVNPTIGINDNDRYPAKTFSIIHELVHILKRQSSICNDMFSSFSQNDEEVFCNAVAGECLVPKDALNTILHNRRLTGEYTVNDIADIAASFSVSKEVITRRLLDCGKISKNAYNAYMHEIDRLFAIEKEEQRETARVAKAEGRQAGFPKRQEQVAIDKTSSMLCRTLYSGYCEEYFSKQDVARYLEMNQKHVDKFLKEVALW